MDCFNITSLILGVASWVLPIICIIIRKKISSKYPIFIFASLASCLIAVCCQLFATKYFIDEYNWTGLLDTAGFVASLATILVAITIVLNAIILIINRDK